MMVLRRLREVDCGDCASLSGNCGGRGGARRGATGGSSSSLILETGDAVISCRLLRTGRFGYAAFPGTPVSILKRR